MKKLSDFDKGFFIDIAVLIVLGIACMFVIDRCGDVRDDRMEEALNETLEVVKENEKVLEEIRESDPAVFLDDEHVRGAADTGYGHFEQRRDEIMERYRSGRNDSGGVGGDAGSD
jgi:hypothetical protein